MFCEKFESLITVQCVSIVVFSMDIKIIIVNGIKRLKALEVYLTVSGPGD